MRIRRMDLASMSAVALIVFAGPTQSPSSSAGPAEQTATQPAIADDAELSRLYAEDQSDRQADAAIDWSVVLPRDRKREARVKEMYRADKLRTGADYLHAAMILQHASTPEDYLLAHEWCVIAIGMGEQQAKWLAAATEDRFLMNIGRPQRFGTQYRSDTRDGPPRLYNVDPAVTDALRRAMNCPSLAAAKEREALMQPTSRPKP